MTRRSIFAIVFFAPVFAHAQCDMTYIQVNPLCYGICDGQITVFPTGSAPFEFTWSTGDTTQSVDSLCAGTYTISMIDDIGCAASVMVTLTEPAMPFTVDTYLVSNSSVSGPCEGQIGWSASGGQPDYTINWYDCNTMSQYTDLPYFCAGEYFSVFIDENGCIDTSDCVVVSNNVVDLSEQGIGDYFSVYPNPAQDLIWLSGPMENAQVCLLDLHGRTVYETFCTDNTFVLNVSHYERGIYLVQVKSTSGVATQKIVLQ